MTTDKPRRTEEEIASEYIDSLVHDLTRKRLTSILVAILFVVLGTFALVVGLPMLAFCCLMIVFLGLIRYWDATTHVDDVRRRPRKFLHAPISVLRPKVNSSPAEITEAAN